MTLATDTLAGAAAAAVDAVSRDNADDTNCVSLREESSDDATRYSAVQVTDDDQQVN